MNIATLISFIVYLVGMLAIGLIMYKRTEDLSDYVLGGRSLGPIVGALSAGASDMSEWLMLGLLGAIYAVALSAARLAIGLFMYKRTHDLSDYVLGGRSLGPYVGALSAGASDMSGWLMLGLPGAIFATGLSEAWLAIGLATGAYLNWQFIAKRLRIYT